MPGLIVRIAAAALALAGALPAGAVPPSRPASPPPAQPSSAVAGVAASMSEAPKAPAERLAAALSQIGLTACAARVLQAGAFLFEGGDANFVIQPLGPEVNRWPTVVTIESAHAGPAPTRMTTLTVSPGLTCAGFYLQTIVWPTPCDSVRASVFSGYKPLGVLLRRVQVLELNPGVQLYLTPANGGCVSQKKELFR